MLKTGSQVWAFLTLGSLASACDVSFPDEYRIEDFRVLNIKAEPPEIPLFQRGPSDPLPLDTTQIPSVAEKPVQLTALIAHPDLDATMSIRWLRCGAFDDLPCTAPVSISASTSSIARVIPARELLAALAENQAPPTQLAATLVEDPRDIFNGFFAYVNLSARVENALIPVDTPEISAEKRVILFDPRLIATAIREAGRITNAPSTEALGLPSLCTKATELQRQKIYDFLERRVPNTSPVLVNVAVELTEGVTDTPTRTVTRGEVISIKPGESLSIRPEVAWGASETYSVIDGNCNLQTFEEHMAFSWFTNLGSLSRHTSTDRVPAVEFSAPAATDLSKDLARIYLVVRDGRGGSDHFHFDIKVSP